MSHSKYFVYLLLTVFLSSLYAYYINKVTISKSIIKFPSNPFCSSLRDDQNYKSPNLELEGILNMRDLSTASANKIAPGKFYRTGCVSGATASDIKMVNDLDIKVWIDLRSIPELEEDEHINSEIYHGSTSIKYDRSLKNWKHSEPQLSSSASSDIQNKTRYFVEVMSEKIIKKGVFERLRKRSKLAVIGLLPFSMVSKRSYSQMKSIFVKSINTGGLQLLNELAIENSAYAIIDILKVITEESSSRNIGIFCTAGKDRTGLISMLILSILGASDDEIAADYILSDTVYSQMKSSAKVAALSQVIFSFFLS